MAPSSIQVSPAKNPVIEKAVHRVREPLKTSGSLHSIEKFDVTTVIGTEFSEGVQLTDLLSAPNSDNLIRDLAILVSQRGVVFFRSQDITVRQQEQLGTRLGELSGKPATSKLHIHPLTAEFSEFGDYISVISSEFNRISHDADIDDKSMLASGGWHADITFEKTPSDYAILKIHTLPETGGDTLWASAYEAYDRLSPAYRTFLEGLTAIHSAQRFNTVAARHGRKIRTEARGAPDNVGDSLRAIHPVIRTNPVTGWKGLFVNKEFTQRIVEVTKDESDAILAYLFRHVSENHDLQVRFKWNKNDIAIWDNRSVFHTATNDYDAVRTGDRVVSLGEHPYFDPASKSRREALKA